MAVTISLYNQAAKVLANSEVDLTALKLMLLGAGGTFTAADAAIADVDTDEVFGSGWDEGGEAVAGAAVTTVTTNDARLDANDVSVTATGAAIGPAENAVLYDSANDLLLCHIAFGEAKTADEGTPFNVVWDATGIINWTYT
jgi:hypothetical protein